MTWFGRGWAVLAVGLLVVGGRLVSGGALAAGRLGDDAPAVVSVSPPQDAVGVPLSAAQDGSMAIAFSEPVALAAGALELVCERSLTHVLATAGGPVSFSFVSDRLFLPGELCRATARADFVADVDAEDPPDSLPGDMSWTFRAAAEPVVINELDAVTAAGLGEFVELYDGGYGDVDLGGLTVVFYRGDEASVYLAVGLDGYRTNGAGYFVLGDSGVAGADLPLANGTLLDGPDAVAVYAAPKSDFPRNAPVTTDNLLDAVVYGPADAALLVLLKPGQSALDEGARGAATTDSLQRCPNGSGQPRETTTFKPNVPTPGESNRCSFDAAPTVVAATPLSGASAVPIDATIEVDFSEAVTLAQGAVVIDCEESGSHLYTQAGSETSYTFVPDEPFARGETCTITIHAELVSDNDAEDPPDQLGADVVWSFGTISPAADNVLINEVDADTAGVDNGEFIELYDGGEGHTSLDGLVVVLVNGGDDSSYLAVSLDGYSTGAAGYFLLANAAIDGAGVTLADGALQNGPDAVALVEGSAADFPNGKPVSAISPLDAVVYGRLDQNDPGLQPLLNPGQPQIDENGRGQGDSHSNQRCPNGAGGPRNTAGYKQNTPTPGAANDCVTDTAPAISAMNPDHGATGVAIGTTITIEFTEPVSLSGKWLAIKCDNSGTHGYRTTGGPLVFSVATDVDLGYAEKCTLTVDGSKVADSDTDDPPDAMARKVSWSFTTADAPAGSILINEVDADTPGGDAAEFIELFDGGTGNTALDGLTLVLFNGSDLLSYRSVALDGLKTDAEGYFIAGNVAVNPDLTLGNGALQNGPDAVALYIADVSRFPNGSPIILTGLVDALVYGDATAVPAALLDLLADGQEPVNENGRGAADIHSMQRCPNGSGAARETKSYALNLPTPGAVSFCEVDEPPRVAATIPAGGAIGVSPFSSMEVSFSEPVQLATGSIRLICDPGGERAIGITGGPSVFGIVPAQPLSYDAQCRIEIAAPGVTDVDSSDPPDEMVEDYEWSFATSSPPPDFIVINELDSDTPGSDKAEFIELFDGGAGHTDLSGLVLVLYNGQDDRAYHAIDLDGAQTDGNGFLVVGNSGVAGAAVQLPDNMLQNGADAVALYAGDATGYPSGTAIQLTSLIDAVVYGTADLTDTGLLSLLESGEPQVDEAAGGSADLHSIGRCPDGGGGQRRTTSFRIANPTPGVMNSCALDAAPVVLAVEPVDGAVEAAPDTIIKVTFSEAVAAGSGWITINCGVSGEHPARVEGNGTQFTVTPETPFLPGERCEVTIHAAAVADADSDDPPDNPTSDFSWHFNVGVEPADFILINEVDTDTPGKDTAEFIELFDGGIGNTSLAGLVLVLWDGKNDKAYRTVDLSGSSTNESGYFIIGNGAIGSVDIILPNGALQNGPDAVAVYVGRAADFPNGATLVTRHLLDAVVYGPADQIDDGLLALLENGQPQVDEGSNDAVEIHSLQRCPNGYGGQRRTEYFEASDPTPGQTNDCLTDAPPVVLLVSPAEGARDVHVDAQLSVTFSEDVILGDGWIRLNCASSGEHSVVTTGGPRKFMVDHETPFVYFETCRLIIEADFVHDSDENDPPDMMETDMSVDFTVEHASSAAILINEVDADTPNADMAEFIELYDGGVGNTALDGLVVVLWNGSTSSVYRAFDLEGLSTGGDGFFTLGNAMVEPDLVFDAGTLQNGPDAVALFAGRAADFLPGMPLTTDGLIDAIVYGPEDEPAPGLLPLLEPDQLPVDEGRFGEPEAHSLQRCPDGSGGLRQTDSYRVAVPTPGGSNTCIADEAPRVDSYWPADGATDVALDATIVITFSEPVNVGEDWFTIDCSVSGVHPAAVSGGLISFALTPETVFSPDESCIVTIRGDAVMDSDADDPPDGMTADVAWAFRTGRRPVAGFSSNSPIRVGETAVFSNGSVGPGPLGFLWDFGDGGPSSSEVNPTRRYAASGHYVVTLWVRGPSGEDRFAAVVEVRPWVVFLGVAVR